MTGADAFYAQAATGGLYSQAIEPPFAPFGAELAGASPLAAMAMQFMAPQLFGAEGFLGGAFLPTQNLYSQVLGRQYQAARMRALEQGFAADKGSYVDIMKGLARLTGTPFGLEQVRAANVIAGDVAAVMPYIAPLMPATVDQLHGPAGSRGLLADAIFRRGLHELDPLTGTVGLSADAAAARASGVFRALYESGTPGSGVAAMRGIGAGSAGQMFAEMQRLGIAGAPSRQELGAAHAAAELAAPGTGTAAVQALDAGHAAGRIKELAGAVSAMRDLFGDSGHPDAPMPVLIKAINDLTQGGLATMDPRRIEETVRNASASARQAGVSLDAMAGVMAQSAGYAERLGVDRAIGAHAGARSLDFGAALGDAGRLDVAAFGRGSKDEYTLLDARLRVQAAASPLAKSLAVMKRFRDDLHGKVRAGSDMEKILAELDAGRDVSAVAPLDPQALMRVMTEGGVPEDVLRTLMEDREGTQEAIRKYRTDDAARRAQPAEARSVAARSFRDVVQGRLMAMGKSHAEARAAAERAAGAASEALFTAGREVTADERKRQELLVGRLRGALGKAGAGLDDRDLELMAAAGFADFGRAAEAELGFGAQKALDVLNPRVLEQAETRRASAAAEARIGRAMSGLGRNGPMARLVDLIRNPPMQDGKFDLAGGLAKFLGGVSGADLDKALSNATTEAALAGESGQVRLLALSRGVHAAQADFEAARRKGDAAGQQAATARIEAIAGGDKGAADKALTGLLAAHGLKAGDLDAVLSGKIHVSADVRDQARALAAAKTANFNATAAESGLAVNSKVDRKDADAALDHLDRAARMAGEAAGLDGAARERKLARAREAYRAGVGGARDLADAALGDEASLAALGPGGLDVAKSVRKVAIDMEAVAAQQGTTVEALLASTATDGPEAEAARQVRSLHGGLQAGLMQMHGMFGARPAGGRKLTEDERKAWAKYMDEETGGQLDRNRGKVREVLRRLGVDAPSEEAVDDLAGKVGTGAEGDARLSRLMQGVRAAEQLAGGGPLSGNERAFLEKQAGALGKAIGPDAIGRDLATAQKSVGEFLAAAAKPEEKKELKITGVVKMEKPDEMVFTNTTGTPIATTH